MWANVLTVVLFNAFLFYTLKNNVNEKTKSLDFPVNRLFMKLFKTSNIQMVNDCQVYFGSSIWKSLPEYIVSASTLQSFQHHLKPSCSDVHFRTFFCS